MTTSTRVLADQLGVIRRRPVTSNNLRCDNLPVPSSPSTNRALPAAPHTQTWSLSEEANKKCGTCRVCFATRQLHNKDGTIHKHGPRDNPFSGSHQPPQPGPLTSSSCRQSTSSIGSNVASSSSCINSAVPASVAPNRGSSPARQLSIYGPRCHNSGIPKGAAATNLLSKLIRDVLRQPLSTSRWSYLHGFSSAWLAKPLRGGKSRILTTQIVK